MSSITLRHILGYFLPFLVCQNLNAQNNVEKLPAWQQGMLDIHHINTGRGNSTFMILPDGTTLLIDAGSLDKTEFEKMYYPLKSAPAMPADSISPGKVLAGYIRQVSPSGQKAIIDYALITHFHVDHYGELSASSPPAGSGEFKLTGITELGTIIPIHDLIDRNYPNYDFPVNLREYYKKNTPSFENYLAFAEYEARDNKMQRAGLRVGVLDQIKLCYRPSEYPSFHIRNIKSNNMIWSGTGSGANTLFTEQEIVRTKTFNENPLSIALKISYGPFDYYTGGDNTGYEGTEYPGRRNVETPMSKIVGQVDAMSLDHHGNRDANNGVFLKTLSPQVAVAQSWCSDQPGQEIAFRLTTPFTPEKDTCQVFALYVHPETKTYLGPWITKSFKSMSGHVLIRVMPIGKMFYVYVLDDTSLTLKVKSRSGPYYSK